MKKKKLDEAFKIFDKVGCDDSHAQNSGTMATLQCQPFPAILGAYQVAYENPLWGEGYHLRAKCYNAMKAPVPAFASTRSHIHPGAIPTTLFMLC